MLFTKLAYVILMELDLHHRMKQDVINTVQASGTGVAGTAMAVLVFEKEQMSFLESFSTCSLP